LEETFNDAEKIEGAREREEAAGANYRRAARVADIGARRRIYARDWEAWAGSFNRGADGSGQERRCRMESFVLDCVGLGSRTMMSSRFTTPG
jgi:hypothetical protein